MRTCDESESRDEHNVDPPPGIVLFRRGRASKSDDGTPVGE